VVAELLVFKFTHHELLLRVVTEMNPISSYADDPSEVAAELQPCLDKAKDAVPKHQHKKTPIFLGATAGMRILRYVRMRSGSFTVLSIHFCCEIHTGSEAIKRPIFCSCTVTRLFLMVNSSYLILKFNRWSDIKKA